MRIDSYIYLDHSYEYNCTDEGCDDAGICRCAELNSRPIKIISSYPDLFHDNDLPEKVRELIINHFMGKHNLWDTDKYICVGEGGYYGEEYSYTEMSDNIFYPFFNEVEDFLKSHKTLQQAIEGLLALEYNEVLPRYKNLEWELKRENIEDLLCDKTVLNSVKNPVFPNPNTIVGLYFKTPDGLKIIDGYHRLRGIKGRGWKTKVWVLVGKNKSE